MKDPHESQSDTDDTDDIDEESSESSPARTGVADDDGSGAGGSKTVRILLTVVLVLSAFLAVRLWVFTPFRIPTASMEPTLRGDDPSEHVVGDTVLVAKLAYLFSEPRRWDLVAFRSVEQPDDGRRPPGLVKRIVGLPGERIEITAGELRVDGKPLRRPDLPGGKRFVHRGRFDGELVLGPDQYFVLGDNSYLSRDSRHWGPLPRSSIFGRVIAVIRPWSRARWLGSSETG